MTHYDFFVIGGGSGGVRAARIAGSHGANVGIAEGKDYGGTCVNIGCVPKKLYTYAAHFGEMFDIGKDYGWGADNLKFDWSVLQKNKDAMIERIQNSYKSMLDNANVTRYQEYASFVDANTLQVGNTQITADKILIATGGVPFTPDIKGAEHFVISDDMFALKTLPKKAAVYGGGYIGVEFACILNGLGVDTTIIYRGDKVLRGFDDNLRDFLTSHMSENGIHCRLEHEIDCLEKNGNTITLTYKDGKGQDDFDLVLAATGRKPLVENLNLSLCGVKTDKKGAIQINKDYQTSQDHIYAVGDVTNRHNLTPIAIAEGHLLADRLYGSHNNRYVDYTYIPTAVFSHPPLATVGMSEQEAMEKGEDFEIYKNDFRPMMTAMAGRGARTMLKLLVRKSDRKIIGCHMGGEDVPEILQAVTIAMNCGATKEDFDRTIPIHPTMAEELCTMRIPMRG